MSDTGVNQFLSQFADATERVAFVPSPPTFTPSSSMPLNGYLAYQQDDGSTWAWDQNIADWVQTNAAGSGTVTNTGTLTANQLIVGNGTVDIKVSDLTGDVTTSGGVATTLKTAAKTRAITFAIDGGGSALTTGIKADVYVPYACTITAVTMLADQSGSVVVDIWKDALANYPPDNADSITSATPPTISSATNSQDTTLSSWTTSISAGDTLRFNIDSATTITRLSLTLTVTV